MATAPAEATTMLNLDPARERTSNRVELIGYVGHTPEMRYTPEGEPVVQFALATHRWHEDEGGPVQTTDWHMVIAFGEHKDKCVTLETGALVRVAGWLQSGAARSRTGTRRGLTCVVLTSLKIVRAAPVQPPLPLVASATSEWIRTGARPVDATPRAGYRRS